MPHASHCVTWPPRVAVRQATFARQAFIRVRLGLGCEARYAASWMRRMAARSGSPPRAVALVQGGGGPAGLLTRALVGRLADVLSVGDVFGGHFFRRAPVIFGHQALCGRTGQRKQNLH